MLVTVLGDENLQLHITALILVYPNHTRNHTLTKSRCKLCHQARNGNVTISIGGQYLHTGEFWYSVDTPILVGCVGSGYENMEKPTWHIGRSCVWGTCNESWMALVSGHVSITLHPVKKNDDTSEMMQFLFSKARAFYSFFLLQWMSIYHILFWAGGRANHHSLNQK